MFLTKVHLQKQMYYLMMLMVDCINTQYTPLPIITIHINKLNFTIKLDTHYTDSNGKYSGH